MSLSKNINPSLVLVQPRKTRPYITEILLMGRKESNQANEIGKSVFQLMMTINFVVVMISDSEQSGPEVIKQFISIAQRN